MQPVPPRFYTGKQKILDTGGRVAKFEKRFGNASLKVSRFERSPPSSTNCGPLEADLADPSLHLRPCPRAGGR